VTLLDRGPCVLHWEEAGEGTPVLLIMGAVYSSAMWYPTIPALAASHRVLSFDNRGTGRSGWTSAASIEDMTADALAVMNAAGVDEAHVYGISLGGVIALELALSAPERVRSLILGCTGILTRAKPRAPLELNDAMRLATRQSLVDSTTFGPACPPEARRRALEVLLHDVAEPEALVAQQDALRAYSCELEQAATLTVPTLVLHGTHDTVVDVQWGHELVATIPNSRLRLYENVGHNYPAEVGDVANEDVLTFLAEVDAADALLSR
jgi:3-oxoadipate enol-lactonase